MEILKKLYATVDINRQNSSSKIKYYETKKENYGIEIVREVGDKILTKRAIDNITDKKTNINKILEMITRQLITPEGVEYIENDLIL